MIAEQPSLTQYEWSIYHMKEKLICYDVLILVFRYIFIQFWEMFSQTGVFSRGGGGYSRTMVNGGCAALMGDFSAKSP